MIRKIYHRWSIAIWQKVIISLAYNHISPEVTELDHSAMGQVMWERTMWYADLYDIHNSITVSRSGDNHIQWDNIYHLLLNIWNIFTHHKFRKDDVFTFKFQNLNMEHLGCIDFVTWFHFIHQIIFYTRWQQQLRLQIIWSDQPHFLYIGLFCNDNKFQLFIGTEKYSSTKD